MGRFVRLSTVALLAVLALPLPARAQETVEYYGLDALGSVRVIFDAQGGVVSRMDYGPFGENLREAIKFPTEQFAQLHRDAESGQDYAQARNYSAGTGRFNRVDPVYAGLFDPQGWNRYSYGRNAPGVYVDPDGRFPVPTTTLSIVAIAAISKDPNRSASVTANSPNDGMRTVAEQDDAGGFAEWLGSSAHFVGEVIVSAIEGAFGTVVEQPGADGTVDTRGVSTAAVVVGAAAGVVVAKRPPRPITLYRSVSAPEVDSIRRLGRYAAGPSVEGKYFYPTQRQAIEFARASYRAGYGEQTLTSVTISRTLLAQGTELRLPGEGQAFFFSSGSLPSLPAPQVIQLHALWRVVIDRMYTILVNISSRERLRDFRTGAAGAFNLVGIHVSDHEFLRIGALDAIYLSLTAAERWGSRPLPPYTVALLRTTEDEQREGLPPYVLTGMVMEDGAPDTPAFVIPKLAGAIRDLRGISETLSTDVRSIGFFERDLAATHADAAELGRLLATEFGL